MFAQIVEQEAMKAYPLVGTLIKKISEGLENSEVLSGLESDTSSSRRRQARTSSTRSFKAEEVARLARSKPEGAYTYATIGGSGGLSGASGAVDEANVYVRLVPKLDRAKHQEVVAQELRRDVAGIGGVVAWISKDTFGNLKEIQVQLRGPDIAELNRLAPKLADLLRATPGAVDVGLSTKGQKPEIDVELDRPLAGTLGVTVGEVAQALRQAWYMEPAGSLVK